ncbi:uncharacterized protein LOC121236206 [Juglans microcarpa x Juglans regia]|uniref:uncharacterized protein LOC121236206 n=1 Tax=Juglans microcarpa x Juglans regia TaxID=2249226 RepID=UPI001B7EF4F9|nr:uncharacterized protein LOC121236206 [Juglans microcarpa x Juglans regia]
MYLKFFKQKTLMCCQTSISWIDSKKTQREDIHWSKVVMITCGTMQTHRGLTTNDSLTKLRKNMIPEKGKKVVSPHVVRGKGRPPTKRKVGAVENDITKRKKKHVTCRKIFNDEEQLRAGPESAGVAIVDNFVIGTQCSSVTPPIPLSNEERCAGTDHI